MPELEEIDTEVDTEVDKQSAIITRVLNKIQVRRGLSLLDIFDAVDTYDSAPIVVAA